jgi:zinc transport system permease protein
VSEFLHAVAAYPFLQLALLSGLLASVASGIVGSYVVTRRVTYLAGSISHFVLGGMGAARYLQVSCRVEWITPFHGALASAVLGAVIVSLVTLKVKEREDTVIGALWAVGMAAGILFVSLTPGYNEDLMSYLFGSILMATPGQLRTLLVLDGVVVIASVLFYNLFLAVSFDDEFARLRGVPVELMHFLLVLLVSLTVVVLSTVVGIVMVIALLTLPAAVAGLFVKRLWQMMVVATIVCSLCVAVGMAMSFALDIPAGATIILLAGFVYLLAVTASALRRT